LSFLEIAKPLIERGIPVIRLRPRSKIAMDSDWPSLATTDLSTIEKWNKEVPDANCGCVAKPGGICVLEIDDPNVQHKIREETGQTLPVSYIVRSSIGKGHFYYKSNSLVENLSADDENGRELWSFRADNQYVVSEKSIHPKTGEPYEARSVAPIVELPAWLLDWMKRQKTEKKVDEKKESVFAEGSRNKSLASMAGKLRHSGLNYEEIEAALLAANQARCNPPLSDDEVRVIAGSISRYAPAPDSTVLVGGQPAGQTAYGVEPAKLITVEQDLPKIKPVAYPVFPEWVLYDTSIYRGLVEPVCAVNCRYPYMMFMPAMCLLLNYLGTKVRIEYKNISPSLYMVLIGKKGQVLKSSSVEDAISYMNYAGLVDHGGMSVRNAEGKSLVWTIGSSEGLGKEMLRTNCKNIVLYFDELKQLISKSNIESSSILSSLLTLYESGKFQNMIKENKSSYSFEPGTYCTSLIACSTDKNFLASWSKLSGDSSGLDDRVTFLFQPEVLKPLTPYQHVNTQMGALETRKLVDKAVNQGVYSIFNSSPLAAEINTIGNRAEIRAEKYALGFSVDLGEDYISDDAIERALAVVAYEESVKKFLAPFEASTREGSLQMEVLGLLRKANGTMTQRDLFRQVHPERHGTTLWNQAYQGLIKGGWIVESGQGTKGDPKKIILLRVPEEED
jgi:hypothetical protein